MHGVVSLARLTTNPTHESPTHESTLVFQVRRAVASEHGERLW